MQKDAGQSLMELRVDGGAAANDLLMQFQADLLGVPVVRPKVTETTALGAAYLAGLTVALWKSRDELRRALESRQALRAEHGAAGSRAAHEALARGRQPLEETGNPASAAGAAASRAASAASASGLP
jgi:glycerol kinase